MNNSMNIFIIGAGAIGKVLAVILANAGYRIHLLRASTQDVKDGSEEIKIITENKAILQATVSVSSLASREHLNGVVIVASKSYGNKSVVDLLKNRIGNSPVVILQNGLGVENEFIDRLQTNVYRCVLFATSQFGPSGQLLFRPVSNSLVGTVRGNDEELSKLVEILNTASFPFKVEKDIQRIAWKKSVTNCVFNSLCPLLETDNGIFHRNVDALHLATLLVEQCVKVANHAGVQVTVDETIESLLAISKLSDGQLISTYQDILNGRETEIDTLNLAVAATAAQQGNEELTRETKLLGKLIQLKASIARKKFKT